MTTEPTGAPASATEPRPSIDVQVLGDYQTNGYVVHVPDDPAAGSACWIVDCGQRPAAMIDDIRGRGLEPAAILLTHAHLDHIAGIDEVLSAFGRLPVFLHEAERDWCGDPMLNLSGLAGQPVSVSGPTDLLTGGETLELGSTRWRVVHAPGHSPGSVLFVHDDSGQAIVGDTLFAGSIGRFDFPTSNPDDLRRTIAEILRGLPDETRVLPGHGPETTVGRERTTNPFVLHGF